MLDSARYEQQKRGDLINSDLTQWNELNLANNGKPFSAETKMLIILFSNINGSDWSFVQSNLDFDHIIPKDLLKKTNCAVNNLGNCCLLTSKSNRSKGSLNFYEYLDQLEHAMTANFVENNLYPSRDSVQAVYKTNTIESITRTYNNLVKERSKNIINFISKNLN